MLIYFSSTQHIKVKQIKVPEYYWNNWVFSVDGLFFRKKSVGDKA